MQEECHARQHAQHRHSRTPGAGVEPVVVEGAVGEPGQGDHGDAVAGQPANSKRPEVASSSFPAPLFWAYVTYFGGMK